MKPMNALDQLNERIIKLHPELQQVLDAIWNRGSVHIEDLRQIQEFIIFGNRLKGFEEKILHEAVSAEEFVIWFNEILDTHLSKGSDRP